MTARPIAPIAALLVAVACYADKPQPQFLFDGRSLEGWQGNTESWRVENGAIVGEIPAGKPLARNEFLFWDGELGDFELSLEFRISGAPGTNSGIQFRSQRLPNREAGGYQADLDDGATWLGRIYDEHGRALIAERGTRVAIAPDGRRWVDTFAEPSDFADLLHPSGEWNSYQISAVASHVELRVNGELVAVLDDREQSEAEFSGALALQLHSGEGPAKLEFRDIQLVDLGKTELPTGDDSDALTGPPAESIAPVGEDGRPLNFSFESNSLQDWTAEGDAWQSQPGRYFEPDTPRRKAETPTTPVGSFWIGDHTAERDRGTGTLTSAPFIVTHRWGSYMVGGGENINLTRVEIVEAETGKIVQQSFGDNSDTLRREVVDFQPLMGKQVFIRLVDQSAELNGRVAFDDFVFHDREPVFTTENLATARLHESPVLWHLQPNSAEPTSIENLDAQKVVRGMSVQPGFVAELVAAEPQVHQPIAFTFDERGRIWVAEAHSYPNKRPEGEGKDRIIIFEDADGDGSFDKQTVFADGLNLVSALEVGLGGVWVGAAPELLFIPDANGDDHPDGPPEVLLDGWGYQDTHETLNSFTWGPDGWLYGLQGVFTHSLVGKPGDASEDRHRLRAGVWRYHPQRHEFEIFASGGSNQWGLDYNEIGDLFMTHCRSFHGGGGTTYVIRNAHFWNQANSDYAPFISNRSADFAPDLKNYLPSSARYDSGEGGAGKPGTTAVYGGHSHVGTMIYLGDNWPDAYRDHLFTNNLHGQQINHQHNVRQGSAYETFHAGYDLLFAPDPTYLPVDLDYGPDGAAYIIDWCDHQHCHFPVNEAWERHNGRIYRLAWADTWQPRTVDLGKMSDTELADLHTHRSEWFTRTARRLLQERSAKRAIQPAALEILKLQSTEAEEVSQRLRAIWTLFVTENLNTDAIAVAARDESDAIRSWAVRLATQTGGDPALPLESIVELARNDPSPVVRLAIASAAPALPKATRWEIVEALAAHGEDANDRFLPKMVWFALAPLVEDDFARAARIASEGELPTLADSIHWHAARSAEGRRTLLAGIALNVLPQPERIARVMAFALRSETALEPPTVWSKAKQRLRSYPLSTNESDSVDYLSALFGDSDALAKTRAKLADESLPIEARGAALDILKRVNDQEAAPHFVEALDNQTLRPLAIPLIGQTNSRDGARKLIALFDSLAVSEQAAALTVLTSSPALAKELIAAVTSEGLDRKHLNSLHLRQMRALNDASIDRELDRLWPQVAQTDAEAQRRIEHLTEVYDGYPKWSLSEENGRMAYLRTCSVCHKFDGEGVAIGPDLDGSSRNGANYFLENIIAPNAVVGANYQLNIITKIDGSALSGMIEAENENTVTVRTAADSVVVPKNQIQSRETLPQSMMPAGLLDGLSEREILELLKYLTASR